jgi:Fe-S-cluster-containing dehydrogenase component/DMSO reductase anchor subunit
MLAAPEKTLIDLLLEEQRQLTAVDRFSRKHDAAEGPAQSRYYRDLIPLEKPQAHEQYAFEVNLDQCTSCKACVSACHSLNGLDEQETWRDVGLLYGGTEEEPRQQTVTTACHHCADPACANGCPVLAYEKDEATGIVRHLDDQCIGCQYCMLKCPYDVPKYSKKRGIVRKCDMCHSRLSAGEAPACVQACPNEAIRITKVPRFDLDRVAGQLVPGTFDSNYTQPTTRYHSKKDLPDNLRPADHDELKPECPHLPLVFMLVLTQLSVGGLLGSFWFAQPAPLLTFSTVGGILGIAVSILHLGQPLKAWRVFLGLARSWLSREVVLFGLYAPLSFGTSLLAWLHSPFFPALRWLTLLIGCASLFCSIMVYVDTRREFWRFSQTAGKFAGSSLWLGLASALWWVPADQARSWMTGLMVVAALKLTAELLTLRPARHPEWTAAKRSALLLLQPLKTATALRFLCGLAGSLVLPLLFLLQGGLLNLNVASAIFALTLGGELLERYLFFRAVIAWRMPGSLP